ncbi:signal peptidase I [Treponema sp.]|uniref:signal peptidase I n=1 Tax=Treponema sp. TaxID=166 RepID=UPI003890A7EE
MEKNIYAISYKMRKELYHRICFIVSIVLLFYFIVSIFLNFIIFPVSNKSDSMSPDIPSGSYEFVCPLLKSPERGEVILMNNYKSEPKGVFKSLLSSVVQFVTFRKCNLFEQKPVYGTRPVIRRVVGIPGDTIYMNQYVVFIKPAGQKHFLTEYELSSVKYNPKILVPPAGWDSELGAKSAISEITLGPDEYFVLGDNRISASDSRIWGTIKQNSIIGKCVLLYFPFNKFKPL